MKFVLAALLLLAAAPAVATPLEDAYVAARDAYVDKFAAYEAANDFGDQVLAEHDRALADLAAQLKTILGPVAIAGFSNEGAINLDTLFGSDEGFAMLDGLVFPSLDGKASVLVTTNGLLRTWLRAHEHWWDTPTIPQDVEEALTINAFYTQAISADAAVARFATIPVEKPAGAVFAHAMLDMRSQDYAIGVPDEITAVVAKGERVYVIVAPVGTALHAIPACDDVWRDYEARSAASTESDEDVRLLDEGEVAYHQCFAARAPDEAFFAPLTAETQALVDRMP